MNMHIVDWLIVFSFISCAIVLASITQKYTKSTVDFLAAGRCAGRYIMSVSEGMSRLGAVSVVAIFEMYYIAGFVPQWWGKMIMPISTIIAVLGWVIYRFRQTRAMTMAQFFEMRYSRKFRVFAGTVAYLAGIINFGIFPAVGSRFFIYFCGFPEYFNFFGINVSTFVLVMVVLLSISLYFTLMGGQIAVIITDFFQGMFILIVFLIITAVVMYSFDWSTITEALETAPKDASLVHPFHTSKVKDFNVFYFLIEAFGLFYSYMAWQGSQGYQCSAKSPHEARMGKVVNTWRGQAQVLLFCLLPICAYTIMHHPDYAEKAQQVNNVIEGISNSDIHDQLIVPLAMTKFLPVGIMGAFCAVMFAAFVSTHDTYLHSWGSIFIQDIILPFRKKPFTPKQHLLLLRVSVFGVAIFVFCWSLVFRQTQHIFLFFRITGAIFLGGAGAVIIGGLYWKRGTTVAAWSAMITGAVLAVSGVIVKQVNPDFFLNGQVMSFIAMVSSSAVYIVISLCSKSVCNMDRLLHRGKYAIESDNSPNETKRGLKLLVPGREFSKGDRVIYVATYIWIFLWFAVFMIGTIYNLTHDVEDSFWFSYWHFFIWLTFVLGLVVVVWFSIGGYRDLRDMFAMLSSSKRDYSDDGTVLCKEEYLECENEHEKNSDIVG